MNRTSLALGAIAVFFAGTTVYFARELRQERERHATPEPAPTPPALASAGEGANPSTASASAAKPTEESADKVSPDFVYAVTTATGQRSPPSPEQQKKMAIAQSRKFMAQLAEPGGRERLIEQHRSMIRSSEVGLAAYLHFDADQYARFVNLRAEQDLKLREHTTHCMLDEHCSFKDPNFRSSSKDISESTNRDIASMFGAETVERYQFFLYSGTQRETVTQLRGRLSDSARLSDAKADQLIRAWMDEAASINEDMKSVGYGVGMYNSVAYAVMQEDPDGKRAAAAAEYNRRIRDRAATVLSNEQLAVYTQMQSEALEQARQINSTTREN